MIKLIMSLLMIVLSVLFGKEAYKSEKNRVECLYDMSIVAERIIVYITYGNYDVYTICKLSFEGIKYIDSEKFLSINDGDFKVKWEQACTAIPNNGVFIRIGEILGMSDRGSQVERIKHIVKILQNSYEREKLKLQDKKKIYYAMSCFVGITVISILI